MTERELARAAAHRLAIIRHAQEVTSDVALTCRYYGISRHTYCIWLRRYEEHGVEGLRDRSRGPLTSPNATTVRSSARSYLRKTYHFGPEKISMYLKRYHDLQVSRLGVWRIPQAPRDEPAAELTALQTPRRPLESLREPRPGLRFDLEGSVTLR